MLTPHGMQVLYDSKLRTKKKLWAGVNQRNGRVLRRYTYDVIQELLAGSRGGYSGGMRSVLMYAVWVSALRFSKIRIIWREYHSKLGN